MPTVVASPEKVVKPKASRRTLLWILLAGAAFFVILLSLLAAKWPFTREAMIKRLEHASSASVEMRGFRSTYFPYPGCIAEEVVFRQKNSSPGSRPADPIIAIRRLTIETTLSGLLSKPARIKTMIAEGLRVYVPPGGASLHTEAGSERDQTLIEELRADNAVLELGSSQSSQRDLLFQIHHVAFQNIGTDKILFQVSLRLPEPPGEVESKGELGPWKDDQGTVRSTPISGTYVLARADLGVFNSLGGIISSRGDFSGNLKKLNVAGTTESPDFEVKESGHHFRLNTQFRGTLDMETGDLVLPSLQARLGSTTLTANARVSGWPKTVALNVTHGQGEIQDLILLFSNAKASPILGPVTFETRIVLPPEHRPFKERVQLTGNFSIARAQFSSANTQDSVDQLSERAEGKKDKGKDYDQDDDTKGFERVLTDFKGQVLLKDGIATFAPVGFAVPGAQADMKGTYSLLNNHVNLKGKMRMLATVSQASTGAKSVFLKVLDPFYRKKKEGAGAEVPITMTGTYGHTHFTAGLK